MDVQASKMKEEEDSDVGNTVFPHDIMVDILSRLPATNLMQFRFVSKSWYKLIRDPFFTNMQHSRSKVHGKLIISNSDLEIYMLDNFQEPDRAVEIKKLRMSGKMSGLRYCLSIWGSCNGLVCIEVFDGFHKTNSSLYLWNPTTMEHRKINGLGSYRHFPYVVYGLGYNPKVGDYEILAITELDLDDSFNYQALVSICSVRKNSWTKLGKIPYEIRSGSLTTGVYFNGAFHWPAETVHALKLIAYDTRNENCREIPLPDVIDDWGDIIVQEFKGKICVVYESNLWVMNEYGVKDSWTKLLTVQKTSDVLCGTGIGVVLRENNDNIILCDPEEKTERKIYGMSNIEKITYCTDNLTLFENNLGLQLQ